MQLAVTSSLLPTANCLIFVGGMQLAASGYFELTTHCQQPTAYCLLLTAYCKQHTFCERFAVTLDLRRQSAKQPRMQGDQPKERTSRPFRAAATLLPLLQRTGADPQRPRKALLAQARRLPNRHQPARTAGWPLNPTPPDIKIVEDGLPRLKPFC